MRLRIISGSLKGLQFDAPSGHRTHPMSERARGAIFNVLGDISGLTVLDTFSGSGALAFEACSRGASAATAIELDKEAFSTIGRNIEKLNLKDKVTAIRANAPTWAVRNLKHQYDIVFCDPPYDKINYAPLMKLARITKPGGIIIFSMPVNSEFTLPEHEFELMTNKQYAGATLAFYKAIG